MITTHTRRYVWIAAAVGLLLCLAQRDAAADKMLYAEDFSQVAEEGFGDIFNNAAWSMKWWNGKLYVGTVRSWFCWSVAAANAEYPVVPYPGVDEEKDCAESPLDLPLRAEIWRYTPETETWERVYQSPEDIPIPKDPSKYVARDIGFRGMEVFTDPDGTEALYVFGAVARRWTMTDTEEVPCPRILRTTDGVTFEALPPDPHTPPCVDGYDVVVASYRSSCIYNGRFFLTGGNLQGTGVLLETDNPGAGKDNIQPVVTEDVRVWEMIPFNDCLYVGTRDREGYSVLKTKAEGEPPYDFTPIVTLGGDLLVKPSKSVVSMFVFKDRLYVGTDEPAEMIRINPDDSWDLVVGKPRRTPDGKKYPISGFINGFDWPLNVHIWRMQEHDGVLYAGTADQSTRTRNMRVFGILYEKGFGFDLYASSDGWYWTAITTTGFSDKWQMGIRTFASTDYGLFFGTCNFWGGLQIWQGLGEDDSIPVEMEYLGRPDAPERLEAEQRGTGVVLSWDSRVKDGLFRVFRAGRGTVKKTTPTATSRSRHAASATMNDFVEIGSTDRLFYRDTSADPFHVYVYYVVAEERGLGSSGPSNLVRTPVISPKATWRDVIKMLNSPRWKKRIRSPSAHSALMTALTDARLALSGNTPERALETLREARRLAAGHAGLAPWQAEDITIILEKLARRVKLVKAGVLTPSELD